jgi:hypothetical protein
VLDELLSKLARPLRNVRHQSRFLEKALKLELSPSELESVLEACSRSNTRLGGYYYWYLQKLIIARRFRSMDRRSVLQRLRRLDLTDYGALTRLHEETSERGLLIAIPHHANYILSIIGMAEHLRRYRCVYIFYGSPETRPSNELFDELYRKVFGDEEANVRVIHDNRAGLADAIRSLRARAVVIIMPDVFKDERDTYTLPFCGRPLNVMLGTAAIARKTGSYIAPAVSLVRASSPRFAIWLGQPIKPSNTPDASEMDAIDLTHLDYRTTAQLFQAYERAMADNIIYWQHARTHYTRTVEFPELHSSSIRETSSLFFNDPRIRCVRSRPVSIDTKGGRQCDLH